MCERRSWILASSLVSKYKNFYPNDFTTMITYDNTIDAYGLPPVPFSLYFLDNYGQVSPKRIFTVTDIRMHSGDLELFIGELQQHIVFDLQKMIVCMYAPN